MPNRLQIAARLGFSVAVDALRRCQPQCSRVFGGKLERAFDQFDCLAVQPAAVRHRNRARVIDEEVGTITEKPVRLGERRRCFHGFGERQIGTPEQQPALPKIGVGAKPRLERCDRFLEMLAAVCLVLGLAHRRAKLFDFDMARDNFIKKAGTRWYTLDLQATDNLTLEHVTCQCPVLGVWQSGLIVLHDGKPRAVGESQVHHNLYPTSSKLIEGEPLRVVSHKVDLRGRTLRWLIERLDKRHTYYLSGEMMGSKLEHVEDLDLYRPADFDGKVLQLHYARAEELGSEMIIPIDAPAPGGMT